MSMLRTYMALGGPMMWPLLLCSIALGAVFFERLWVVGVRHHLLRRSLDRRSRMWHRRVLPFFTEVPPSLGLLGTVIGVVHSFQLVDGRVDGESVGAGLAIACMTTLFGLAIAIVAVLGRYTLDWVVRPVD